MGLSYNVKKMIILIVFISEINCQSLITNPNFKPQNYVGPKWYNQDKMSGWQSIHKGIPRWFHAFYVTTWSHVFLMPQNTTCLRLRMNRATKYIHNLFSMHQGKYQASAIIFTKLSSPLTNIEGVKLAVQFCNSYFSTDLSREMQRPQRIVFGQIILQHPKRCGFVIFQTNLGHRKYKVFLSNIQVLKIQPLTKMYQPIKKQQQSLLSSSYLQQTQNRGFKKRFYI